MKISTPKLPASGPRQFGSSGTKSPFARDYNEARDQFRGWHGQLAGARLDQVTVPSREGEDLSVDILTLPATETAENVLVISSGVHGAEGAPGSAMQELFLKDYLPKLDRSKSTVILVHAVNPWGFKHNHRYTENNVDLNRNSVKDPESFKNYPNKLYTKVQRLMTASKPPRWYALSLAKMGFGIAYNLVRSGFDQAQVSQSVAGGQNIDPRGVNYASKQHESQLPAIRQILEQNIGQAKNVIHYDIHTGLGARGHLHVIDTSDPHSIEASREFISPLTDDPNDTIWHNSSKDKGFYDASLGVFTNMTEVSAAAGGKVLTYVAEVGTLGKGMLQQVDSATRLHERNSLEFFRERLSDEKKEDILDRCTQMYNPTDESWRRQTTDNFRQLFDHTVEALNKPSITTAP